MKECQRFNLLGWNVLEVFIKLIVSAEKAAVTVECAGWQVKNVTSQFLEIRKAFGLAPENDDVYWIFQLESSIALNL